MRRTDDLQFKGLILYQDTDLLCFTEDSVLLSNFLKAKKNEKVIDLGCGNGVLSILGEGKTGAFFTGIDLSEEQIALAKESAATNSQDIAFYVMDAADAPKKFGVGFFDAAVCNPPYFTSGDMSSNAVRATARHQGENHPELFLKTAFQLLKNGGNLYLCYPTDKLTDIICSLRENRLEPKEIQLIHTGEGTEPRLALIRAKKDAASGVIFHPVQTAKEFLCKCGVI